MGRDVAVGSAWERSGAADLTGLPDGPPLVVPTLAAERLDALLVPWGLDASILAERARLAGLRRGGRWSCGRATRLLESADGWVAVSLARRDDIELLPAWLGIGIVDGCGDEGDGPGTTMWGPVASAVDSAVASRRGADLVDAAIELGLPCAVVGEVDTGDSWPAPVDELPDLSSCRIVDLSALWAGPLCAWLLGRCGADVVCVEDIRRRDHARGFETFTDRLRHGVTRMSVDFSTNEGGADLRRHCRDADVVVTSARQRAFVHLSLMPDDILGSTQVWAAITAYGWDADRVGFGDDVAASAGLVAWPADDTGPYFAADAIADPITGVVTAARIIAALEEPSASFIDASMAATTAFVRPATGSLAHPSRPAHPAHPADAAQSGDPADVRGRRP